MGGTAIGLLVAGLASPRVGGIINSRSGRPVIAASSLLYAAGLAGIGLCVSRQKLLMAWAILGLRMGSGLYDAVFAALGRMYGHSARGPISNLTLFFRFRVGPAVYTWVLRRCHKVPSVERSDDETKREKMLGRPK